MSEPAGYRWQVRVEYRYGRSQAWPCDDEAAARAEYARLLAVCRAGLHPTVAAIALRRRPVPGWEDVESRRFGEGGGT